MPQIVRNIHHHDTTGHFAGGRFHTADSCGCEACRATAKRRPAARDAMAHVLPRAVADALSKAIPPLMKEVATLDRAVDRYCDRVIDARACAIVDRVRAEAAAPLFPSAISGYVRDAAGNRIRPMTPADLQRIHDQHYGRGQPASPMADTQPASAKRPVTPADLTGLHSAHYGRRL